MTGFVFLVICGYLFYSLVWIVRYMQLKSSSFGCISGSISFAGVTFFIFLCHLVRRIRKSRLLFSKATVGMVADSLKKYDVITSVRHYKSG